MSENNLINQVRNEINIVDIVSEFISLDKKGKNYIAICPFHEDNNPSMSVSEEKQIYHCFSCKVGGDAIKFYSSYKKISYRSALEILANKMNIKFQSYDNAPKYTEKIQKNINILNDATLYFQNELYSEKGIKCLAYLKSRKMGNKAISTHKMGFSTLGLVEYLKKKYSLSEIISVGLSNDRGNEFFMNRLMFPIENIHGDVIAFSARSLSNEQSKYINSPDSNIFSKSKILYNFKNAREYIYRKKEIIITEGFFDVIALERIEIYNVIAIMGTALTDSHIQFLKNFKVILMLDSDIAGITSMNKSLNLLLRHNISTSLVINKEKLDPEEYLNKFGKQKLIELINKSKDGFLYLVNWFRQNKNISNPIVLDQVLTLLSNLIPIKNESIYDIYISKISSLFNISISIIKAKFNKFQNENYSQETQVINDENSDKKINEHYSKILKWTLEIQWTLLENKEFCKWFIDIDNALPIVNNNGPIFKDIARKNVNNSPEILKMKERFLKEHENKEFSKIKNKNIFFDIIEKLSIESLRELAGYLLRKLENKKYLEPEFAMEAQKIHRRWRQTKEKIKNIQKER